MIKNDEKGELHMENENKRKKSKLLLLTILIIFIVAILIAGKIYISKNDNTVDIKDDLITQNDTLTVKELEELNALYGAEQRDMDLAENYEICNLAMDIYDDIPVAIGHSIHYHKERVKSEYENENSNFEVFSRMTQVHLSDDIFGIAYGNIEATQYEDEYWYFLVETLPDVDVQSLAEQIKRDIRPSFHYRGGNTDPIYSEYASKYNSEDVGVAHNGNYIFIVLVGDRMEENFGLPNENEMIELFYQKTK